MEILNKLQKGEDLKFEEAVAVFNEILSGEVEEPVIEAALLALAAKGETRDEIAGCARAMLDHAIPVQHNCSTLLDIVGTGGDGSGSFNISTAAAVVCSLFVPVAKHGNRAFSSRSGAADVLEALGVPINLNQVEAAQSLSKKNFAFLFAQKYHPAMKSVAAVRKKLARRTIFNLLGPLCNPARPNAQLVGIFSESIMDRYVGAIERLEIPDAFVVSSKDGMDEISVSDRTVCCSKKGSSIEKFEFDPKEFGIYAEIDVVKGYDPAGNAKIMREILRGEGHRGLIDAVSINAAFALTIAEVEKDLKKAFILARETMESGKAYDKLTELVS